ncbi:MAG TPA: glutathione S-transferase N-terminal domain-containing protein [Alphaproteobacteria bacterium]|jgi:GST-like protein|nr:glutathione S-transferase N-terminal domain-containing protein [Alphaproteobacteria bacterium]
MIELYAWGTTNGRRALIMAEESGLPFNLHQINIQKGDQKTPEYEKINPYRKIPALVDSEGPGGKPATLFESVAICFYLGEKTGKFLGSTADHPNVLKWSMFHATNVLFTMGGLGRINDPSFESGSKGQLETMNKHLQGRDWFCDDYSIADIIPFTRINGVKHDTVKVADYPNVQKWLERVANRPAVKKAMERKFG